MQKMTMEAKTVQVLKNFSSINSSLLFKPGNTISTISPTKNIMARAKVNENFETQFAIYDVGRLLSVMSLFESPELNIGDKCVTIRDGDKKVNYTFADPSTIVAPPEKEIKLPTVDVEVRITSEVLQDAVKALSVLRLPELAFVGDGETVSLQAIDSKNPSGDVWSVRLGETDSIFKMIIKAENIKVLPADYVVRISSKGIAHFESNDVEYFIAIEASSSFDG